MNPKESAFNDAKVIVATSNTATYLINRLRFHPLVKYLTENYSALRLNERLLLELKRFDKSLQQTTIILLLTQAILNKTGNKSLPAVVRKALAKSEVMWARELLSLSQATKRNSTVSVTNFPYSPSMEATSVPTRTSVSYVRGDQS